MRVEDYTAIAVTDIKQMTGYEDARFLCNARPFLLDQVSDPVFRELCTYCSLQHSSFFSCGGFLILVILPLLVQKLRHYFKFVTDFKFFNSVLFVNVTTNYA